MSKPLRMHQIRRIIEMQRNPPANYIFPLSIIFCTGSVKAIMSINSSNIITKTCLKSCQQMMILPDHQTPMPLAKDFLVCYLCFRA